MWQAFRALPAMGAPGASLSDRRAGSGFDAPGWEVERRENRGQVPRGARRFRTTLPSGHQPDPNAQLE